jgi:predicted TIM-barrel fold metal-dependent hydrolase
VGTLPRAQIQGPRNSPRAEDNPRWFFFMQLTEDSMLGVNMLFQGGVLERFPKLNYVILETGCGWVPGWVDRADGKFELFAFTTRMSKKPSQVLRERCWISTDVDEAGIAHVARTIGANHMMWATDYPHIDAHSDPVAELRKHIAELSAEDQAWILGKTAAQLYRL